MEKEFQKKSLDRFFRNEYQKLVNFVRKNLDERYFEASPEDIIQNVALGLIDKLDLDTQIGNLTGYIYRSVKNKIIDYQKKKRRTVSIESFEELAEEWDVPLGTLLSRKHRALSKLHKILLKNQK